jgi:hypothetical protein
MPELTVLWALVGLLRERVRALPGLHASRREDPEAGGIISEYAVVLGIAVAAVGIIAVVIAAIRGRFSRFVDQP